MATEVVGRGDELATIRAFLGGPAPAALLLEGDAGIGKTSLWREAVEFAGESGQVVLVARPASVEAELSFAALSDLLTDILEEVLPALSPPQRRALEVALLRTNQDGAPPDPRAIGTAVLSVFAALAAQQALLVAIDDLQWLDIASAAALTFAVRRLRDEPVRLLLSARTDADGRPMSVASAIPDERLRRLEVEPLSAGAVAHLLRARMGLTFGRPVARQVYETSGGNPFFAIELARALERHGGRVELGEPLPVPSTLQDLVAERLGALPPATREALLLAALGSEPTVDLVGRLLEGDPWARLEPAVRADAVEVVGGHIRFAHPLIASVAAANANAMERHEAHRRLADVVEEPEERARHLSFSADGRDEKVAVALERAAERAASRGAPDLAAVFAERAGRLTPVARPGDEHRRLLRAADHYFDGGALEQAATLLDELVAGSPQGPDRAKVLSRLAQVRFQQEGVGPALELQLAALKDAGNELELRATVDRILAWARHMDGDLGKALVHARAAVGLATSLNDPDMLAPTLATLAFTEFVAGEGMNEELIAHAVTLEPERAGMLDRARWIQGLLLEYQGELERSEALLQELLGESRERGERIELAYLLNHLSRVSLRAGDRTKSEGFLREVFDLLPEIDLGAEEPFVLSTCALLDAHGGRVEQARERIAQGLALAARRGMKPARFEFLATLGFLELSLGDAEAAARTLGSLREEAAAGGFLEPAVFRFHGDEIEALLALGRLDEAQARLDELEARPGRWAEAAAGRARGLLEATSGDVPRAVGALEEAREQAAALGDPFELARTLLALGVVQRRAKQRGAARESLTAARLTFEQVGARLWGRRARDELARVGGRAPSDGELTPMERRVTELVAAGKSNRETAAELVVTVRTVETHLSHIYRKLGVRSRTELAAQARRETAAAT